jgi:hypothetical protein
VVKINKKKIVSGIVFFMIATLLLISLANTAFASTPNGFYVGGSEMKYFSVSEFGEKNVDDRQLLVDGASGLSNITIVLDGKAAKLNEIASAGDFYKVAVPLKSGDLVGNFKNSLGNTVIINEQSKEIFEVIAIK